ncbi:MAG: hypothetical protein Solivirus2_63 [Solivirus sp.]|uniref:Uncharacterized protein n=1 Tax=Solivirus sp. TaxID=2487772 RepID=A0A3G5AFP0_9VIRU|nr:MAG: hypothetical protein Solivirus2_63 [Solivirus sp.]
MFSVLLNVKESRTLLTKIQDDQPTLFLSNGYILFIQPEEPEGYFRVEFSAGQDDVAVTAHQNEPEVWLSIEKLDRDRDLIITVSLLQFYCNEYLDSNLYFQLKRELNVERTKYNLTYILKYGVTEVYMKEKLEFPIIDIPKGAMLICSKDLVREHIPLSITKGFLQDAVRELGIRQFSQKTSGDESCSCTSSRALLSGNSKIDTSQLVYVTGPTTNDLYLFFEEPALFADEALQEFIVELNSKIDSYIQLQLFPSSYSGEQKSHMKQLSNGQFELTFPIEKNFPLYREAWRFSLTLTSLSEFYQILEQLSFEDFIIRFYNEHCIILVIHTTDLERAAYIKFLFNRNFNKSSQIKLSLGYNHEALNFKNALNDSDMNISKILKINTST